MDELERKLMWELRLAAPPDGFTDGVMARVARERLARARRTRMGLAAMVLLGMLSGTAVVGRQHREREQEVAARQRFDLAMQVTGRTLSQVEKRIGRIDVKSNEVEQ